MQAPLGPRSGRRHSGSFSDLSRRSLGRESMYVKLGIHIRVSTVVRATSGRQAGRKRTANRRHGRIGRCVMCQHKPSCPPWNAMDRQAARVVAAHPEQGWNLLCNGVVLFDDNGELPPDRRAVPPPAARRDLATHGCSREARVMASSLLRRNDRPPRHQRPGMRLCTNRSAVDADKLRPDHSGRPSPVRRCCPRRSRARAGYGCPCGRLRISTRRTRGFTPRWPH